jgi:hypothetical protein
MADRVDLSHELADQRYGRPVVKALRDLAQVVNQQARAIPDLAAQITTIVRQQLSLPQIQQALSPAGSNPLNPPAIPGGSSGSGSGLVKYGTHAQRLSFGVSAATDGVVWYETDRALTYQYHDPAGWRYLCGIMVVSLLSANPLPPGSDDGSGGTVDLPADSSDGGATAAGVAAAPATGHPAGAYDGSANRAGLIIGGTAHEWPALIAITADQAARDANMETLLRRMVWHLILDGYTAGRQRNPSGIVSLDKLCVVEAGTLRCFDVFTGVYTAPMTVQAIQVSPANLVIDAGIPD